MSIIAFQKVSNRPPVSTRLVTQPVLVRRTLPFTVLIFCMTLAAFAGENSLTNDAIVKMVGAGIGEDVIIAMIKSEPGRYNLTADSIIALHKADVSDRILAAMLGKESLASAAPEEPAPGVAPDADRQTPAVPAPSDNAAVDAPSTPIPVAPAVTGPVAGPSGAQALVKPADKVDPTQAPTFHGFSVSDLTSAFIGTGWLLTAHGTDYKINQSSNVIEATGIGRKTPDFLFGAAFNTTLRPRFWRGRIKDLNDPHLDGFVSLKFTPGSQDAINGLVLGGAIRIHPNLDFVVGVALTPQSAPAIGFRNAAFLAALSDPAYYAGFNARNLLLNKTQAYDGFPLANAAGKPIYPGDPLTTQYRNGLFIGVAFPVSLSGLFKSTASQPAAKQ